MKMLVVALLASQVGCGNDEVEDAIVHTARSLEESRQVIQNINNQVQVYQRKQYNEARFNSRELYWGPKIRRYQLVTDSLVTTVQWMREQVGGMKPAPFVTQYTEDLARQFSHYREVTIGLLLDTAQAPYWRYREAYVRQVADIDTLMRTWWSEPAEAGQWKRTLNRIDVLAGSKNIAAIQRLLDLLLLDIQMIESRIYEAFGEVSASHGLCGFGRDIPMVLFLCQHVGVGDSARVMAGVGETVTARSVRVQIDTTVAASNHEGEVILSIRAKSKPGRYTVPVSITWLRPDSTLLTWTKNIQYAVAR
ncbi:hypothetical protein [Paraflavitalea pollutisoli]|uniref:hypothetical protein n=1 Tax=Paraflavitalea pollutisoli TaxID=3034143 RepID=UPI0023EAD49F|nr:hypothetical protein [Paraflavitalea sp. H1-2-19X]